VVLVEENRVGCARVFVKRWRKYGYLEVDLLDCRPRGLEPLDLARDVARLLYGRVILRSEAWSKALRDHPLAGAHVVKQLLEFIERGEVACAGGARFPEVAPYFFKSPRVWTAASPSNVAVVAEKHVVEDAVAEVERLLGEKLLEPRPS
jgi:hypothetical protein